MVYLFILRIKIIDKTKNPTVDIEIMFYGIEYLDKEKNQQA